MVVRVYFTLTQAKEKASYFRSRGLKVTIRKAYDKHGIYYDVYTYRK